MNRAAPFVFLVPWPWKKPQRKEKGKMQNAKHRTFRILHFHFCISSGEMGEFVTAEVE